MGHSKSKNPKLTQAIESAHADRSADENGKGIHNRMDHVGEHEQVSSEDAGIEYSDSETPHLGVLNDKGEIDEEAQRLYNVLHGAKLNIKNVPSEAIEQANKLDQEHANRISEKKKTSQDRLEEIEKDKDTFEGIEETIFADILSMNKHIYEIFFPIIHSIQWNLHNIYHSREFYQI